MEWISQNKEWLFSGILITIPITILGWFFVSKSKAMKQKGGKNSVNIQAGKNINFRNSKKHSND